MFSNEFCEKNRVAIYEISSDQWCLAFQPPLLPWVYQTVVRQLSEAITLKPMSSNELDSLLQKRKHYVPEMSQTLESMATSDSLNWMLDQMPENGMDSLENSAAPVIQLINTMLEEASSQGASDIHIETFQHYFRVRYRIDGVMQEISKGDARLGSPLISRLKIMSKLDIAERRLPQDGRFVFDSNERNIDVRLSIIPVSHGERAVLRLLNQQQLPLDFSALGMPDSLNQSLTQQINRPHGIILVTGPTGSGKSSTLYACLQQLNLNSRTILTIEDPIEYKLPGLGQTQVNDRIDLSFSRGLRALLRQDPDIVMIGEIRDSETAHVAVQASLTGHLVFSTLHTNSAAGAIARLCDMGIEPWLLSSSLTALLSQRLVRKLCSHCKSPYKPVGHEKSWLHISDYDASSTIIYRPTGCEYCGGRGYSGRTGIYELIVNSEDLSDLIHNRASTEKIEQFVRLTQPGINDHARQVILEGITSFEEVMRVVEGNA